MKTRCFDHIDLRVTNVETAKKFYRKFLPQLGFVHEKGGRYQSFYSAGGDKPSEFFGFTRDKKHKPNGTRIAFWADTREEVDRVAKLVRDAGGKNLEGPEVCKGYSPGYYAFFFEDPDGQQTRNLLPREAGICGLTSRGSRVGCDHRDFAGDTPGATLAKWPI
jgi:catechol 2,3-dioxygenase-like lactoylglutathione lyase family enzyme